MLLPHFGCPSYSPPINYRTTAAIVLEICYGIHVADTGDEYVALADQALAGISSSGNFGTFAVDYFPLREFLLF
jgi:hypothetical protein